MMLCNISMLCCDVMYCITCLFIDFFWILCISISFSYFSYFQFLCTGLNWQFCQLLCIILYHMYYTHQCFRFGDTQGTDSQKILLQFCQFFSPQWAWLIWSNYRKQAGSTATRSCLLCYTVCWEIVLICTGLTLQMQTQISPLEPLCSSQIHSCIQLQFSVVSAGVHDVHLLVLQHLYIRCISMEVLGI